MSKQIVSAWIKGVGCLVAVYTPTFVLVTLIIRSGVFGRLTKSEAQIFAIPLVVAISAAIAMGIIALFVRLRATTFSMYGFRRTSVRNMLLAIGLGLMFALLLRAITWVLPINKSLDLGDLRSWQIVVYFWLAAPIQEEIIFRGLLQHVLEAGSPNTLIVGKQKIPQAVIGSALLFAAVHIAVGLLGASVGQVVFIVVGALILGLLASYLRWRANSLMPSIVVHALFNILVP